MKEMREGGREGGRKRECSLCTAHVRVDNAHMHTNIHRKGLTPAGMEVEHGEADLRGAEEEVRLVGKVRAMIENLGEEFGREKVMECVDRGLDGLEDRMEEETLWWGEADDDSGEGNL